MSDEEFTLLPLIFPDDASTIAALHYPIFHLTDPDRAVAPMTEEEFIKMRTPMIIDRLSGPGRLMAKMVLSDDHERLVSYIVFSPPKAADERSDEEKDKETRARIEENPNVKDKELVFRLKTEDRVLNEKFFGKGFESRYWELSELVTDEKYQRRGLGTKLVEWGLNQVELAVKRSEAKLDGCYLIASQQGQRTYTKAGFDKVGERNGEGLEEKYRHCWFIKRFD